MAATAKVAFTARSSGDAATEDSHVVLNGPDDSAGPPSRFGSELSGVFVSRLPVGGASISVIVAGRQQSTVSTSDSMAAKIDELQFALGEGPHWDALSSGKAVSAPNIQSATNSKWPVLGAALAGLALGALFAFPLRMGAVTVGVADLYKSGPGALNRDEMETAWALARAVASTAMQYAITLADDDAPIHSPLASELRREVHQATGMILVQLSIDATEAFARLKAHAFASGNTIQEVANDVVMRRLDFRALPE
jgi:hypothetical protein